jgi:DNA methylase
MTPHDRDQNQPADAPESGEADLLHLSAPRLLAALEEIRAAETIAQLREQIAALRQALRAPPLAIDPDDLSEDRADYSAPVLLGELDQIAAALSLERATYYVERLMRGLVEVRTGAINDINLNRWKEYDEILTDSLWLIDRRDGSGVHSAGYWGNFIPQIPYQMMRRYTRKGDWVIDTFAGSGTTLVEGQRLGRHVLGVELQAQMVEHARGLVAAEPNPHGVTIAVTQGDCTEVDYAELLRAHGRERAQLAILHPPYFDIIRFSDDPRDLSNAETIDAFLAQIGRVVAGVSQVLDRGRYLVVVIGDKYVRGDWIPLGFQTMSEVLKHGFSLKSIVVKNFEETSGKRSQKELWRYRALLGGFYVFKHEYIFLFRKQ